MTQRLSGGWDMLEEIQEFGNDRILHDAQIGRPVTPDWFEHARWKDAGQWEAASGGRGGGARVGAGGEWFLRHYLRGGKAAIFSRDRYLYAGERRVRCFAELRMLAGLRAAGLPAPKPVAARYRRAGASYSADLITEWIAGARSLAVALAASADPEALMARVGATVARFHKAGVCHADLNAHNILIGNNGAVWLVDFDRARRRRPGAWQESRLRRLERSLRKLGLGRSEAFRALRSQHDRTLDP